ncbi:MAG TPA: GNAT family N-acetyltransferase [Pseudonocardiaceae bacterium]|jgi:GNAT superfamily N-acetyltransferase|nr:GNAT family N-acetyltransferase [Pseudonocardiaceae bacterium]
MTLSEIQSCLRAGIAGRATRVGAFLVVLDPDSAIPYRNYAVPDERTEPTAEHVAELIEHFAEHRRDPRLEYVGPNAPVDAVLAAGGFTVHRTLPVLALAGLVDPPLPAGIAITRVDTDARLWAVAEVQNTAYGEAAAGEADLRRLRGVVDRGGRVVLATDRATGSAVGAGLCTPLSYGHSELAAIGVLPAFRRRGIAAAVTAELCRAAAEQGARPFLQAEDDSAQRIYERVGFTPVGGLIDARRAAGGSGGSGGGSGGTAGR